jgi:hypothetical protein
MHARQMFIERFAQYPVIRRNGAGADHHNHVQVGQRWAVPAERFSDQAFQPIAVHRATRLLFRYGQAQPGTVIAAAVDEEDREKTVSRTLWPTIEYPPKIARSKQAGMTGETQARNRQFPGRLRGCRCQGVRRARPLARRALITLRPPRVAMRARKPCVRARFRQLGWNVRFMAVLPGCSG